MSTTQSSDEYFDRVAADWDDLRKGYFPEAVRDAALAVAYLRPEMTVADIGCGAGYMSAGLAPQVASVIAIDKSPAMLVEAQAHLAQYHNVEFRQGAVEALPLEDGRVDAAFANMVLHHSTDPELAIREMVRILRPGGRLVITDLDTHTHEWMREEMADRWLGFDRSQVREWLRSAGLVNVIVDCTGSTCSADAESGEGCAESTHADIGVFVATGCARVSGVQQAVSERYGALAAGSNCGCASMDCCSDSSTSEMAWIKGYAPIDLVELPTAAVSLSLGCGNPFGMAGLQPGEVVLDIGSGGGIDVFYAARRVGPAGRAIGLDMTPAMLERARATALQTGATNVEFRKGTAEAMPVDDATIDVVLSNCVINLCEDKGKVFDEAFRVLRQGGRLSISDMVTSGPLPPAMRSDAWTWSDCVHGALPEKEYLALVRQAGFTEINAQRSASGGQLGDTDVYSLSVSARKP